MLILCWNVAGWKKTAGRIHDAYQSLPKFFARHQADIICLQEVKIPLSQLSSRSEPLGCSTIPGFESFWACCVDRDSSGFNGVATYVRNGVPVLSADAAPLGISELDNQGRCLLTDHGTFVIFNVYLPASGGHSVEYKMQFLHALSKRMQVERTKGKQVILAGDLNIKHTALDVFWLDRVVYVDEILEEVIAFLATSNSNKNDVVAADLLATWKRQLANAWPKIVAALDTMQVVPAQTKNTRTGETFDKFRLQVTADNNRRVHLGKHEKSEEFCRHYYVFDEWTHICPETNQECVVREANTVTVSVLAELMAKIANVSWDHATQRLIAATSPGVRRVEPPRLWLNCLVEQDGMVDTFRHFYPTAENRFTCWSQHTNKRYENEGVRLDYILVDASLLPHVQKGNVPSLRCGTAMDDPLGERAALCAATASGAFRPVSFEGEGISEAPQEALDTQFGEPHTGIVYTPPSFSDHVGVSLLLDDACCQQDLVLKEKDAATRKAQPHKSQRSIAAFLTQPSASTERFKSSSSLTERLASAKAIKKSKEGIKSFFVPREPNSKSQQPSSKRPKLESSSCSSSNNNNAKGNVSKGIQTANQKKKNPTILDHFRK